MGNRGARPKPAKRSVVERNALTTNNLGVARKAVARLWKSCHSVRQLGWDDALQVATLALLRAAELWGCRNDFKGYAYVHCRYALITAAIKGEPTITGLDLGSFATAKSNYDGNEHIRLNGIKEKVQAVLCSLPEGPERAYLEARLEGATQYVAWQTAGRPSVDSSNLNSRAIKLARRAAEEMTCE